MDGNRIGPGMPERGTGGENGLQRNGAMDGAGENAVPFTGGQINNAGGGESEGTESGMGEENGGFMEETGGLEENEEEAVSEAEDRNRLETCRERILSNEYADVIVKLEPMVQPNQETFDSFCLEKLDDIFGVIHINRSYIPPLLYENYNYDAFPNLFGLMDRESLDAAGILSLQTQPNLNLRGQGVIIGFIDTGIDYANVNGC